MFLLSQTLHRKGARFHALLFLIETYRFIILLIETFYFLGSFIKLSKTLFVDRKNLVLGFPLTLSSRARGCAPYNPHFLVIVAIPRFMLGF